MTMKLVDFLKACVKPGQKILVYMDLNAGVEENFSVEVMRGQSCHTWREEYWNWLEALNLEVDHVSSVAEDVKGNRDMLAIKCKPLRIF